MIAKYVANKRLVSLEEGVRQSCDFLNARTAACEQQWELTREVKRTPLSFPRTLKPTCRPKKPNNRLFSSQITPRIQVDNGSPAPRQDKRKQLRGPKHSGRRCSFAAGIPAFRQYHATLTGLAGGHPFRDASDICPDCDI